MRTIATITELRSALALLREQGKRVGFVPTMGALHEGHRSLVRLSKQQADVTVVSIFVNPAQFGPAEDFDRYPRMLETDAGILIEEEVEFLFAPAVDQIYPHGHDTRIYAGSIASRYEGARRPGHFDGVATVVSILFNIVQPQIAFFGQKDAQQLSVIRRMAGDLAIPVEIIAGPTIREADGLAMSSRNSYLSNAERMEAVGLFQTLIFVGELLLAGHPLEAAKLAGMDEFSRFAPHGMLDYLDIVHSETFQPMTSFERLEPGSTTIIIAATIGTTRLIDNIQV